MTAILPVVMLVAITGTVMVESQQVQVVRKDIEFSSMSSCKEFKENIHEGNFYKGYRSIGFAATLSGGPIIFTEIGECKEK